MLAVALTGSTFNDSAVCPSWAAVLFCVVLAILSLKLATSQLPDDFGAWRMTLALPLNHFMCKRSH
jgi:hypothetical protein